MGKMRMVMKLTTLLNSVSALAFAGLLTAPAFAGQSMPTAPTQGGQTVATSSQVLMPLPKKWWADD
jgi:hypothetical protein